MAMKRDAKQQSSERKTPNGGGFQAVVDAYKKDIDRTLLRENLKLTVAERFAKFKRTMELFDELRRAGVAARNKQS